MKKCKNKTIDKNDIECEIDISVLDNAFYLSILNDILENKKKKETR